MKNSLLLILLFFPWVLIAQEHLKVIDLNEAKSMNIPEQYINANGKVLITEDYYHELKNNPDVILDQPDELEGWPLLSLPGTSRRSTRFIDIDLDGEKEVIFYSGNQVWAVSPNGETKPGFPAFAGTSGYDGAPVVGNVDSDPELEIVSHCSYYGIEGDLFVFNHDGSIASGFPIHWDEGAPRKEPLLENIDEDPEMEIFSHITTYPTSKVFAYNGDGTTAEFWDGIELDYIAGSGCSSGDLNGDGVPEIIACSYWKLYVFNIKAELQEGFPYTFEQDVRGVSYSNPVIADIDEDGFNEICVATINEQPQTDAGAIYVLKNDGTDLTGWPQYTTYWMYACVAVADLDQDDHLDIIIGDQILSPDPVDYLMAYDRFGNFLPGFPVGERDAMNVQAIIADIDGDFDMEAIVDINVTSQPLQIFHHDGSEFTDYEIDPGGATFFNTALLDDVNGDGRLNLVLQTNNFASSTTDVHAYDLTIGYNPAFIPLGQHQYNSRNTGEYALYDPTIGIQNFSNKEARISVYPNPCSDYLKISIENQEDFFIKLTDMMGKMVYQSPIGKNTIEVDMQKYPDGTYMAEIIQSGKVLRKLFIKQ